MIDLNIMELRKASDMWMKGIRYYDDIETFDIPLKLAIQIGGAWCVDTKWTEDLCKPQYKELLEDFVENGWDPTKPMTIILGTNGNINVDDGNHRILLAIRCKLETIPIRFKYWKYDECKRLTCFPMGTCAKCYICTHLSDKSEISCKGIQHMSDQWTLNRRKVYPGGKDKLYHMPLKQALNIGGAWCIREEWQTSIETESRYQALATVFRDSGWNPENPMVIGIGTNGKVSVEDGNHRLLIAKACGLRSIPVVVHYWDIGDKAWGINYVYSTETAYTCYPIGRCGECGVCQGLLDKYKR